MNSKKNSSVYLVTSRILSKLDNSRDNPVTKASLANLRNSIGKPVSHSIDIFPLVYSNCLLYTSWLILLKKHKILL